MAASSSQQSAFAPSPSEEQKRLTALIEFRDAIQNLDTLPAITLQRRFQAGFAAMGWRGGSQQTLQTLTDYPEDRTATLASVNQEIEILQHQLAFQMNEDPERLVALMGLQQLFLEAEKYLASEAGRRVLERQLQQQLVKLGVPDPEMEVKLMLQQPTYRANLLEKIKESLAAWFEPRQAELSRKLPELSSKLAIRFKSELEQGILDPQLQLMMRTPKAIQIFFKYFGIKIVIPKDEPVDLETFLRLFNRFFYSSNCAKYGDLTECWLGAIEYGDLDNFEKYYPNPAIDLKAKAEGLLLSIKFNRLVMFQRLYQDPEIDELLTRVVNREPTPDLDGEQMFRLPELIYEAKQFRLGKLLIRSVKADAYEIFELIYQDNRLWPGDLVYAATHLNAGQNPAYLEQLWNFDYGRFRVIQLMAADAISANPTFQALLQPLADQPPLQLIGEVASAVGLEHINDLHPLITGEVLTAAFVHSLGYFETEEKTSLEIPEMLLSYQDQYRKIDPLTLITLGEEQIRSNQMDLLQILVNYVNQNTLELWLEQATGAEGYVEPVVGYIDVNAEPKPQIVDFLRMHLGLESAEELSSEE